MLKAVELCLTNKIIVQNLLSKSHANSAPASTESKSYKIVFIVALEEGFFKRSPFLSHEYSCKICGS